MIYSSTSTMTVGPDDSDLTVSNKTLLNNVNIHLKSYFRVPNAKYAMCKLISINYCILFIRHCN